jgi:hypothetical protein
MKIKKLATAARKAEEKKALKEANRQNNINKN